MEAAIIAHKGKKEHVVTTENILSHKNISQDNVYSCAFVQRETACVVTEINTFIEAGK